MLPLIRRSPLFHHRIPSRWYLPPLSPRPVLLLHSLPLYPLAQRRVSPPYHLHHSRCYQRRSPTVHHQCQTHLPLTSRLLQVSEKRFLHASTSILFPINRPTPVADGPSQLRQIGCGPFTVHPVSITSISLCILHCHPPSSPIKIGRFSCRCPSPLGGFFKSNERTQRV